MKKPFDILLIEDHEPDAGLLIHKLKSIPLVNEIVLVKTKLDGLNLLEKNGKDFGLVISDYNTTAGDVDLKKLINKANKHNIHCVLLSGYNSAEYNVKAFEYGAIAYLEKPLNLDQFAAVISVIDGLSLELVRTPVAHIEDFS